jgi:hypothetical protein
VAKGCKKTALFYKLTKRDQSCHRYEKKLNRLKPPLATSGAQPDAGEYRFESVPWWRRYTVYGDDENEGYSSFSTGPAGDSSPPEVQITPEHPEAEMRVLLFLLIPSLCTLISNLIGFQTPPACSCNSDNTSDHCATSPV